MMASSLSCRCDFGQCDVLPVVIHISGHLDLRAGVRRERLEVLVLDAVDLAVTDKHVLGAGLDAGARTVLRILAHIAHPGMACAAHAIADFTRQGLLSCRDRKTA